MLLGCHLSISKGYRAMVQQAIALGANTFQYFTRNPRGAGIRPRDLEDEESALALMQEHHFGPLIAHAPYTYNPASDKEHVRAFARMAMEEDLRRMLPGSFYNFHPGSHVGQGFEQGAEHILRILDEILNLDLPTTLLLETMSGKGSEIGGRFEELAYLRKRLGHPERLGVCLDTCHVHDAGYSIVSDIDGMLQNFDEIIGLKHLHALHLNDSKNAQGAAKDRHEKIGKGFLGLETFRRIVNHPQLKDLPMALETPNEIPGYAEEIRSLRNLKETP